MPTAIVTLSHHPELAARLIDSIRRTEARPPTIYVMRDRHREDFGAGVVHIDAPEPFIFARNANLGIQACAPADVLMVNDDCAFVDSETVKALEKSAYRWGGKQRTGIVSPVIDGGVGNPYQSAYHEVWNKPEAPKDLVINGEGMDSMPVCFVAAFLKREMIEDIGLLDENFTEYGFDDNDYCIRARRAGWWTVITAACRVKHGEGGKDLVRGRNWSASFCRENKPNNQTYFLSKWGPRIRYMPMMD